MNSKQAAECQTPEFQVVPVRDIRLRPDQPRRIVNQETVNWMKQSLSITGQLEPIGVRRYGKGWILSFGYLRLQAAKQLGWKTIQAMEYPETENAELVDLVLWASENLHRSAPELDEIAVTVSKLAESGMSESVMALALGKPVEWVADMLALSRDPLARGMIETGKLTTFEDWQAFNQLTTQARKAVIYAAGTISSQTFRFSSGYVKEKPCDQVVQNAMQDLWPELLADKPKNIPNKEYSCNETNGMRKANDGR